tara:strand:+ start:349 stop:522 length:174 start_codon:yes stop_codon:yes gene_type:complete
MTALEKKAFELIKEYLNYEAAVEITAKRLVMFEGVEYEVALAAAKTALDAWSDMYCE